MQSVDVWYIAAPVLLSSVGTEVVLQSASYNYAREEAVCAIVELDALRAEAKLALVDHNVVLEKAREEWQHEVEAWKSRTYRGEATMAKLRNETSDTARKL